VIQEYNKNYHKDRHVKNQDKNDTPVRMKSPKITNADSSKSYRGLFTITTIQPTNIYKKLLA
jgi:hypothetical protein